MASISVVQPSSQWIWKGVTSHNSDSASAIITITWRTPPLPEE